MLSLRCLLAVLVLVLVLELVLLFDPLTLEVEKQLPIFFFLQEIKRKIQRLMIKTIQQSNKYQLIIFTNLMCVWHVYIWRERERCNEGVKEEGLEQIGGRGEEGEGVVGMVKRDF